MELLTDGEGEAQRMWVFRLPVRAEPGFQSVALSFWFCICRHVHAGDSVCLGCHFVPISKNMSIVPKCSKCTQRAQHAFSPSAVLFGASFLWPHFPERFWGSEGPYSCLSPIPPFFFLYVLPLSILGQQHALVIQNRNESVLLYN